MIRRAFVRALSGAILTTLLGVRPASYGVSYGWIERRGFRWEIEVPWEHVDVVCRLRSPRLTGRCLRVQFHTVAL